jgi:glycosyltransferase involved in cell wall biosynthesis
MNQQLAVFGGELGRTRQNTTSMIKVTPVILCGGIGTRLCSRPCRARLASSCENTPNILLETKASGLPIAYPIRRPMPSVLGKAGVLFNPEQPEDISRALRDLIESPQTRTELARASYPPLRKNSCQSCADETFGFLANAFKKRVLR